MARRLILPAADRYASISAGDIVSAPAMLSKPLVESSTGRNLEESTSSASRSRMAFAYSVAVQTMQAGRRQMRMRTAHRAGSPSSRATLERRRIRARHVRRRHQTRARLAHHDFSAISRCSPSFVRSSWSSSRLAVFGPRVVAGDAVLVDERASRRRIRDRDDGRPPLRAGSLGCGAAAGAGAGAWPRLGTPD